jgi:hypothetical protein
LMFGKYPILRVFFCSACEKAGVGIEAATSITAIAIANTTLIVLLSIIRESLGEE